MFPGLNSLSLSAVSNLYPHSSMCITRGGGEEEVCMPGRVGGKNQRGGGGMNVMFPTSWRGRRGRQTGIETAHLKQSAQMSRQSLGHESAINSSED